MEVVEYVMIYLVFGRFLPLQIKADTMSAYFEKLIDLDGVLLGFSGIIFAAVIQRRETNYKATIGVLAPVVGLYLLSLVVCFSGLMVNGSPSSTTYSWSQITFPLTCAVWATTMLFLGIAYANM